MVERRETRERVAFCDDEEEEEEDGDESSQTRRDDDALAAIVDAVLKNTRRTETERTPVRQHEPDGLDVRWKRYRDDCAKTELEITYVLNLEYASR